MSLATLGDLIWAHKRAFFLAFLTVFGATYAFCRLVTPMYRSEALVMISQGQSRADQVQFPDVIKYHLNSQIYVIESDNVLRPAIAAIGTMALFPHLQLGQSSDGHLDIDQAIVFAKKRLAVSAEKDFRCYGWHSDTKTQKSQSNS